MIAVVLRKIVEVDADRNTLYDLDVVACRIFRWEQAETRTGGSADLRDVTAELATTQRVDFQIDMLVHMHLVELCFLEVRRHPEIFEWNDRQQILPNAQVLTDIDILLAHDAVYRSDDLGVAEVQFCLIDLGLSLLDSRQRSLRAGLLNTDLVGCSLLVLLRLRA
jgi:hypothetical protein